MPEVPTHTVYDYTPEQAEMLRAYELRTTALVGRMYHQEKMQSHRFWLSCLDAFSTLIASSAFVSLAFFSAGAGKLALSAMVLSVAILGIIRTTFRLGEQVEKHSRLYSAWCEIFLDLDYIIASVRRAERLTDGLRAELDFVCRRFARVEIADEDRPSKRLTAKLQVEAEASLPAHEQWLPS